MRKITIWAEEGRYYGKMYRVPKGPTDLQNKDKLDFSQSESEKQIVGVGSKE